jgi:hypothetical protein
MPRQVILSKRFNNFSEARNFLYSNFSVQCESRIFPLLCRLAAQKEPLFLVTMDILSGDLELGTIDEAPEVRRRRRR